MMMNIAEAAASAAKRQGRFKEYDHMGDGDASVDGAAATKSEEKPSEVPFDVSKIKLFPITPSPSQCHDDDGTNEFNWKIAHVADLNNLHLFTTKEKTRCELWAKMWSTSRILAEILSGKSVSNHLLNMKVLEIGAGTAVCGMIAASHGAEVTVTDSSEQSLILAEKSASLNQLDENKFKTQRLNWHNTEDMPENPHYELLIGSDVLFLEMNIVSVINVISRYLVPGGLAVILDPGRPCAEDFMEICEENNHLSVEKMVIEDLIVGENSLMKRAVLYLVSVSPMSVSSHSPATYLASPDRVTPSSLSSSSSSSSSSSPSSSSSSTSIDNTTDNHTISPSVQQVKQSIVDSWDYISSERRVENAKDRVGRSYEYTETLNG